MTILIDEVFLADGTLRPNQGGIFWALWPTRDVTLPPSESGGPISTGADASLTIPSTPSEGLLLLYISDTDMGAYDTAQITQATGQPTILEWYEPFPGFYLLSWQEPVDPVTGDPVDVEGYVVYRDGNEFGATTLRVFATTQPGTYFVRATRNGVLSPPTNSVTIP